MYKSTCSWYTIGCLLALALLYSCGASPDEQKSDPFEVRGEPTNRVVLSSDIEWEALNPARGDKSPQAGDIWGDRKGPGATGFLVKFVDGFSSPPHIHNVSYRALVLEGRVHNDDSSAIEMWMPPGSFWTQPAGEAHITSAQGTENIAYVEIDGGPYLVKPVEEAFDNGERPVNMDLSNMVRLDGSQTRQIDRTPLVEGLALTYLWEKDGYTGNLLHLPAGLSLKILSNGEVFHAVVITGALNYRLPGTEAPQVLDPGSYFGAQGNAHHQITVAPAGNSLVYFRTNGDFKVR